jgi:20S proteasome subunit beta 7
LVRFLGAVDLRGMAYQDRHIATGYGGYIALPLLRDAAEKNPNMSQQQAEDIMKKCLEVLYYRDARSFPKVYIFILIEN